jgi:hypothetical protein
LVLPPEELLHICHATNDGTGDGSGTGEEDTHNHRRSCVSRMFCASHHEYGRKTNKEPDSSTSERTKQRATHKTPPTLEEQNETTAAYYGIMAACLPCRKWEIQAVSSTKIAA